VLIAFTGLMPSSVTDSGAAPIPRIESAVGSGDAAAIAAQAGSNCTPPPRTERPQPGNWPPNRQELRRCYFDRMNSDASGQVRGDLVRQGTAAQLRMPVSTAGSLRGASGVGLAPGGTLGLHWVGIGPQPLRVDPPGPLCNCGDTLQFQGNGPDSGEVVDIAIDPRGTTDQTLYIATNDGGVWKTTDAGATWRPTMDFLPSLSIGAVALDPGNPDIVYAGTGNPFDGAGLVDPVYLQLLRSGVGIYKSIDAGQTWQQVGASVLTGKLINRIVLPASDVLVVATDSGVFRSIDGGQSFGANAPLFNDGNPIRTGFVSGLALDTFSVNTMYAAISGQGLFKSTDGGVTFPDANNLFASLPAPVAGDFNFIAFTQSTRTPFGQLDPFCVLRRPAEAVRPERRRRLRDQVEQQRYELAAPARGGNPRGRLPVRLRPDRWRRSAEPQPCLPGVRGSVPVDRWRHYLPAGGQPAGAQRLPCDRL
jgi:hypothetical protein